MMKKTIFTALLSFLYLFPAFSSASCKEDEIEIYRITDATTRSLTALPEASIDAQSGQLSVSFDSGGTCALLVEDSLGVPVYTSTLPADGMEYSYDLSGIGEGMFRLVIEGVLAPFSGMNEDAYKSFFTKKFK